MEIKNLHHYDIQKVLPLLSDNAPYVLPHLSYTAEGQRIAPAPPNLAYRVVRALHYLGLTQKQ